MLKPTNTKILWTIFLTILIDMLGVGILIPVFPMLVVPHSTYRVIPNNWNEAEGFIMLGWLLACFPLAQLICSPLLGQLADRYGRKKILALSITGTCLSYILFAIGLIRKDLPLMFISRALDGISGANISVAQAVIGDISTPHNRAKNFGLIGMAFGIGFILGPVVGGKLSDPTLCSWFNSATPFWFAATLSFINIAIVLKLLPETLTTPNLKLIDLTKPIQNIIKAFATPGLKNIIPATFMFNAGFSFFTTFWAVALADEFGFSQSKIGNFYAYIGLMIVIAQGLLVRRLSGKVSDYTILRFSIIGSGLCIGSYYIIPPTHTYLIYIIPPFMAACNALTMAFSSALITRVTPGVIRGEVMGINSSSLALAQTIPAMLAGYIAAESAKLPVLVGSLIIVSGGILFHFIFKPEQFKDLG